MSSQSIRTHSRTTLVLRLFIKTTLDHPPSNTALQSAQAEQGDHSISHFWLEISLVLEYREGNNEPIPEYHAHLPVEELYPVNRFESLEGDLFVDSLIFNGLLVLIEFNVPFVIVAGVSLGIGTPICHAESWMCEPSIPAKHDHAQYASCWEEEPPTNETLLAGFD